MGRARLPTLMLAAAANATATPAPGRHRRFTNGFSRRPFRYPARDMGVAGCRMVSGLFNALGWRMILARGRQEKLVDCCLVAIAPRREKIPGVSEPRHLFAQGLHRFRPSLDLARHAFARGLAGLGSFPTAPLHCREPLRGRYRFVPTVENWRDRMKPAAPKVAGCKDLAASRLAAANPGYAAGSPDVQQPRARGDSKPKWPRDFVRPRPALRREAPPVAEDNSNSPRDFVRARRQQ